MIELPDNRQQALVGYQADQQALAKTLKTPYMGLPKHMCQNHVSQKLRGRSRQWC